jgi:ABC-type enterobactin transport system permease subunit
MKYRYRYQHLIIVVLVESLLLDWLIFRNFSDFTRLTVISAITGMFITVEGILIGLSPMIKVPFMRDVALGIGVPALLTAVGAFSVATYDSIQFGSLSANSITFNYWNPAWILFLVLVEWYVLAIIVPFEPQIKEQVKQIKSS